MPYVTEHPVRRKVRTALEANLSWQQFGQSADASTFDGRTACTHVVVQVLTYLWRGRRVSIDDVSRAAGYYRETNSMGEPRGLNNTELARAFDVLDLPYVIRFGLSFDTMHGYTTRGPVFLGVRHGSIPEWRGYTYFGNKADGVPNGFARTAGRTQLSGFENGRHAVLDCGGRPYVSDTALVSVKCSTVVRSQPSISGSRITGVSVGAALTVRTITTGGSWSGCGTSGVRWLRVSHVNGQSISAITDGRHSVGFVASGLASAPVFRTIREDVIHKDPNHNSSSRPENPAYDVITRTQAKIEYDHFRTRLGSSLYGAIPTRQLPV